MKNYLSILLAIAACAIVNARGAEAPETQKDTESPPSAPASEERPGSSRLSDLEQKFAETLNRATLRGRWALVEEGALGESREETYRINQVRKGSGDAWLFLAQVRFGQRDVVVPMTLEVKWAGDTPVITLTKMEIPGLGTYTARVVIFEDTYAGTWSGGDHQGVMHGVIAREAE